MVTKKDSQTISAIEDPEGVNRAVQRALADANPVPDPVPPPATMVELPGGLLHAGNLICTAEVRELTGEHEEALARAAQGKPGNLLYFMNTLLECGVVRFGTEDPNDTRKLLKDTLVGDRDALIIGIRRATYGNDLEMEQWQCPECEQLSDLMLPLDELPVKKLDDPVQQHFTVPLRFGRSAEVRLATGADQLAVFDNSSLNAAERDTILLGKCLVALSGADGVRNVVTGLSNAVSRQLGVKDRHDILRELRERQPGPEFKMTMTHDACGKETEVSIGLGDLFRDFWLL